MAEFGFFGVMVVTLTHTPRLNVLPCLSTVRFRWSESSVYCIAGALLLNDLGDRPLRISWLTVGIKIRLEITICFILRQETAVYLKQS